MISLFFSQVKMNKIFICTLLLLLLGIAQTQDFPKDNQYLNRLFLSAEKGDPLAQFNLGVKYSEGIDIPRSYFEAIKWYKKSANQGFPQAQYNLGVIYSRGKGVEKNYSESMRWYKLAADQGHARSQYNLGVMYSKGRGVKKNPLQALKWYKLSAENGNPNAQYSLCWRLFDDEEKVENKREALKWCNRSAQNNNTKAQNFLGIKYLTGDGVIQSFSEALKWFNLSNANKNSDASAYIAFMYMNGFGFDKNYAHAKDLSWKSCLKGSELGCEFHKTISKTIDEMINNVSEKNSQCRGGIFETEEEMNIVCSERDIAYKEARKLGYCYGSRHANASSYEYTWLPCSLTKTE